MTLIAQTPVRPCPWATRGPFGEPHEGPLGVIAQTRSGRRYPGTAPIWALLLARATCICLLKMRWRWRLTAVEQSRADFEEAGKCGEFRIAIAGSGTREVPRRRVDDFLVIQYQRDPAQAQSAEIVALVYYAKSPRCRPGPGCRPPAGSRRHLDCRAVDRSDEHTAEQAGAVKRRCPPKLQPVFVNARGRSLHSRSALPAPSNSWSSRLFSRPETGPAEASQSP